MSAVSPVLWMCEWLCGERLGVILELLMHSRFAVMQLSLSSQAEQAEVTGTANDVDLCIFSLAAHSSLRRLRHRQSRVTSPRRWSHHSDSSTATSHHSSTPVTRKSAGAGEVNERLEEMRGWRVRMLASRRWQRGFADHSATAYRTLLRTIARFHFWLCISVLVGAA